VARRLGNHGPVFASDIQEYARVLASALTRPRISRVEPILDHSSRLLATPVLSRLFDEEVSRLSETGWAESLAEDMERGSMALGEAATSTAQAASLDLTNQSQWVILRHYGGVYFSYRQAAELDALAGAIRSISTLEERDTAMAALLGAASELATSVGNHFAQPVRPRDPQGSLKYGILERVRTLRLRSAIPEFLTKYDQYSRLEPTRFDVATATLDFRDALGGLPSDVSVIYADPPYTRDHYSRFYHVLETIALGDNPGVSQVTLGGARVFSRGLYRVNRHQSPFSIVSQAPAAFDQLFRSARERRMSVVLSYSPIPVNEKPRARVVDLPLLVDIAKRSFADVEALPVEGVRHSKFNASAQNAPLVDEAEVLLIARA